MTFQQPIKRCGANSRQMADIKVYQSLLLDGNRDFFYIKAMSQQTVDK